MSLSTERTAEVAALEETAARYRKQGFEVVIEPSPKVLPPFLKGHAPDAMATRGEEGVIIAVKSTRMAAGRSAAVAFLAREVPKHEGWRFELVLAADLFRDTKTLREPKLSEIGREVVSLRQKASDTSLSVLLPYAWALLEAAARQVAFEPGAASGKTFRPRTIVERLITDGWIDDEEGRRLNDLALIRNSIVHGYFAAQVKPAEFELLLDVTGRLARKKLAA